MKRYSYLSARKISRLLNRDIFPLSFFTTFYDHILYGSKKLSVADFAVGIIYDRCSNDAR
jgi:hypothetical protein